jgi:hypothetical protein
VYFILIQARQYLDAFALVEAQGWILNANGDVVLTAQANPPNPYTQVSASKCQEQPSTGKVSSVTEIKRN